MPPIQLMIKPVSGSCNMRCTYCFYADEAGKREQPCYGAMSLDTLEAVVSKALAQAEGSCAFAFQGGEPTLAGLDFYTALLEIEKRHNARRLPIHHALQTNGYLIDAQWARFLAEKRFLVGLSLDGVRETHDAFRRDGAGRGTHARVMQAAQLLQSAGVQFNILTTVNAQTAKAVRRIYGFYRRSNLLYQQYIPCLDPLGEARGRHSYSLTPAMYADFLKALFDLWYDDVAHGRFIYIRYFENLVGMLLGEPPESCGMNGCCSPQYVVEADGSVFPCDFYALDAYRLGSLAEDSFDQIDDRRGEIGFIERSLAQAPECAACRWRALCRGGCRRDREAQGGTLGLNALCPAYKAFFEYAAPRLLHVARSVR